MSKKKPGKKPAKKAAGKKVAAKKAPARKSAPKKATRAVRTLAAAPDVPGKRNNTATIFLYKVDGNYRVRTSPQLISAAPGFVEWTVVNLASDEEVDVEISWPGGGPWGGNPQRFKGNERKSLADAKPGRYKYNVTANGYTEDPELEYPEGN
ncbi:MAG: hypothetical protein AB7P34_01970 [Vicinamibacterales bacterium]